MLEIRYVWEEPIRVTHWVNALCVLLLSITGFYIGAPFLTPPEHAPYVMGWMRFVHYLCAYVLVASVLARFYWLFAGNHHASWRAVTPWTTAQGRRNFVKMLRYYTFTGKQISYEVGHNPVAALAYAGIFALFVLQIISGFALYSQYQPGGFAWTIFAPIFLLIDNQNLRLLHHFVMWFLAGFMINHLYSAALMDIKERNGVVSGIISGYKFIEPRDL